MGGTISTAPKKKLILQRAMRSAEGKIVESRRRPWARRFGRIALLIFASRPGTAISADGLRWFRLKAGDQFPSDSETLYVVRVVPGSSKVIGWKFSKNFGRYWFRQPWRPPQSINQDLIRCGMYPPKKPMVD